jgi:hypothetical protein
MPNKFPRLKDGDELHPYHLNIIYRELERWRRTRAAGLLDLDGVDSDSPPTFTVYEPDIAIPANSGSGFAAGSPASPSSQTVTLLTPTGTGAGLDASRGFTLTAYSTFGTAIAANKTIWLTWFAGAYYVVQVDC